MSCTVVNGVSGGNQLKRKSWFDAMTLYNKMYDQGGVVLVRA
jgi:hypothetical protein